METPFTLTHLLFSVHFERDNFDTKNGSVYLETVVWQKIELDRSMRTSGSYTFLVWLVENPKIRLPPISADHDRRLRG